MLPPAQVLELFQYPPAEVEWISAAKADAQTKRITIIEICFMTRSRKVLYTDRVLWQYLFVKIFFADDWSRLN